MWTALSHRERGKTECEPLRNIRVSSARCRAVEHAKPKSGEKKVPEEVDFYRPILDAIWSIFGDDRLIYGSNWPVSDRSASYKVLFSIVNQYVIARGKTTAEKFFWKNAHAAYL